MFRLLILPLIFAAVLNGNVQAQTFNVTSSSCSGPGSIQEAIASANASPGPDIISFTPGLKVHVTNFCISRDDLRFPETYYLSKITDSVTIEGNDAGIIGVQTWVSPDLTINKINEICPGKMDRLTLRAAEAPGFITIGEKDKDNSGIKVIIKNLNAESLEDFAFARRGAALRLENVNLSKIKSIVFCHKSGIELQNGNLEVYDSHFSYNYNWYTGIENLLSTRAC